MSNRSPSLRFPVVDVEINLDVFAAHQVRFLHFPLLLALLALVGGNRTLQYLNFNLTKH